MAHLLVCENCLKVVGGHFVDICQHGNVVALQRCCSVESSDHAKSTHVDVGDNLFPPRSSRSPVLVVHPLLSINDASAILDRIVNRSGLLVLTFYAANDFYVVDLSAVNCGRFRGATHHLTNRHREEVLLVVFLLLLLLLLLPWVGRRHHRIRSPELVAIAYENVTVLAANFGMVGG